MLGQRQHIPRMQGDFYKSWYHKLLRWIIGSAVIMVFLCLIIIYFILAKPGQKYYGTTVEGQIIPMIPLKR